MLDVIKVVKVFCFDMLLGGIKADFLGLDVEET
jgi:hypothetical protein